VTPDTTTEARPPRRRHPLQRLLVAVLVSLGLALGANAVTASPASAYAEGYSSWGSVPYYGIPTGYMGFQVYGSISSMNAVWRTGSLCSWRIDWYGYDKDGRQFWHDVGPTHYGCTSISGGRSRGAGTIPKYGKVCARTYSYGQWLAGVCHTIW
jgi:hypothetical protein